MGVSSCSVGQGVIEGAQASFLPKQWPLQGVCDLKPRGGGFQEEHMDETPSPHPSCPGVSSWQCWVEGAWTHSLCL